jgi:AraC-like DNA-binding protein
LVVFDDKGAIYAYDEAVDTFALQANLAAMMGGHVLVNDILVADSGAWLAMREGVWFLKIKDKKLVPVMKDCFANTVLQSDQGFLLCTRNGVYGYRIRPESVPTPNMQLRMLLPTVVESGFYDARHGTVWLGGYQSGLSILSYANGNVSQSACHLPGDVAHHPIRCFCPFDDNVMLVGIDGLGVYKVGRTPLPTGDYGGSLLFDANESRQGVLHGNGIYALAHDTWGNLIIGSYSGGIDVARPVGSTPAIYRHVPGNMQSLLNDHVNSVAQFPNGVLVMGTDNGISMLNQDTRQWQHILQGTVVLSFCMTPQGTMLAATYGDGVYEITTSGQARQLYSVSEGTLKDDHVYKLFYDRSGQLWMGCLDGDLVQKSATGCHYYHIDNVQDILQMPDGRMAVGTANGLWLIDAKTGEVGRLDYVAGDRDDVNTYVHVLYIGEDGRLWIGTDGGGIYIYDFKTKQCQHLTKANGLPSNNVSSICKDDKGRVQVATEHGLSFANAQDDTTFINVNYCYGIEREYSLRAVVRLHSGFMLYGTTTGVLIVNPENVQRINYNAKLKLMDVSCGLDDRRQFRKQAYQMLQDRELRLSYDQSTFELYFESINLRNQFDIVYQYSMDGGEWSQPIDEQYIRFTNLEPGSHRLLLRSVSRTCGEVLDEVSLAVSIGQPWWNSWWMWVVYVGFIVLLFYGAWRVYQLHMKYMRLVVGTPGLTDNIYTEPQEAEQGEGQAEEPDEEGNEFIRRATKYVIDNLSDSDFNIDQLCREMTMSRTLFYVKLKSYTGKSPQDFIRVIRLERAAALLRNGRSVAEAAACSGFDNPKYFSTVFKKYFGVSPSKYQ